MATNANCVWGYLQVQLFCGSTESLQDVQCRVASIHGLRIKVTLHKLAGLFFYPSLYLIPETAKKLTMDIKRTCISQPQNCNQESEERQ